MIVAALVRLLSEEPAIGPRLARWDFGAGAEPAIFTVEPPADAGTPLLVVALMDVGSVAQARSGPLGEHHTIAVQVRADVSESDREARLLAQAVRRAILKAQPDLSSSGFAFKNADVRGPSRASWGGWGGYEMTVEATALEE